MTARGRAEVRAFLERFGLAARRDLGQNFLCDDRLAEKLAGCADLAAHDTVVEIGTGLGILTRALAARARRVVTLEVDAGIVRALRSEAALPPNVELIHADALAFDLEARVRSEGGPVRVVANLPYASAAPLLRRLLDLRELLESWSVMVQKEVARRLCAGPGSRDYGSLAVLHGLTASVEARLDLHPPCFYPVPRVVSTFLHIRRRADRSLSNRELRSVERIVRAAFAHRRKTLVNSLGQSDGVSLGSDALVALLSQRALAPRARAEELSAEAWLDLARDIAAAEAEGV